MQRLVQLPSIPGGGRSPRLLPSVQYHAGPSHLETHATSPTMCHPPQEIFIDSMSSLMFNLLKSLARLFGFNTSSVPS